MNEDASKQDLRQSLARAFDQAWDDYFRTGGPTVREDLARSELARTIVELSKGGLLDENELAKAGLAHLRRLSSQDTLAVDPIWLGKDAPDNLA